MIARRHQLLALFLFITAVVGCDGMTYRLTVDARGSVAENRANAVLLTRAVAVAHGFEEEDPTNLARQRSPLASFLLTEQGYQKTGWARLTVEALEADTYTIYLVTFPAFDYPEAKVLRADLKKQLRAAFGDTRVRGF